MRLVNHANALIHRIYVRKKLKDRTPWIGKIEEAMDSISEWQRFHSRCSQSAVTGVGRNDDSSGLSAATHSIFGNFDARMIARRLTVVAKNIVAFGDIQVPNYHAPSIA
ncbi:MAG: hypothetical protein ACREIC_28630 [Limisphaerales bacterium]